MTDTSIEDLNIKQFKLRSGEDIIALVAGRNEDNWMIEVPLALRENMSGGVQLAHWFPFSTTRLFKLLDIDIMQQANVINEIKHTYLEYALKTQQVELIKQDDEILEEYTKSQSIADGEQSPEGDTKEEMIH